MRTSRRALFSNDTVKNVDFTICKCETRSIGIILSVLISHVTQEICLELRQKSLRAVDERELNLKDMPRALTKNYSDNNYRKSFGVELRKLPTSIIGERLGRRSLVVQLRKDRFY